MYYILSTEKPFLNRGFSSPDGKDNFRVSTEIRFVDIKEVNKLTGGTFTTVVVKVDVKKSLSV